MSWKEVSPGRFERPLDTIEKFFRLLSLGGHAIGREHWTVNTAAKLTLDPSLGDVESALKAAWKATRFKLPKIAAFAVENTYVYEVPDSQGLESWLADTFVVEPSTTTAADLYANAKLSHIAKLHYLPHTSEILIRSSHYRIDGRGALFLLDTFLKVLADPPKDMQFGTETARLSPGLDHVLNIPTEVSAQMEAEAENQIKTFTENVPSIGLNPKPSAMPGGTRRCEVELSPDLTSQIVSRCKASKFSVTNGVHAAVIRATLPRRVPSPATKWTTWITYDFRKYCPPPFNGPDHAVAIYLTGFPATLTPTNFLDDASELHKYTSRDLMAPGVDVFSYLNSYVNKALGAFSATPPEGTLPPTEPLVGSYGVVDNYMTSKVGDKVQVDDLWVDPEQLTSQMQVYVWTRVGKMKLSVSYNESSYDEGFAQGFLQSVKTELLRGLGIQEEI